MLSHNQTARFFDHEHLWNQCIISLVFLYGDNRQEKVAYETDTFGWMCSGMPSRAQTYQQLLGVPLVSLGGS